MCNPEQRASSIRAMKRAVWVLLLPLLAAYGQTRSRLADYALILKDEPAARVTAGAVKAHLARIQNAQATVAAALKARKVEMTGANQVLVNAVFVSATHEAALGLRNIPGVAHVVRLPRFKPDLNRALDLQNVRAAWSAPGGDANAGAGIKIGIIDSGIDINHPGFQDPSLAPPAGFPKGNTAYTNQKVIVARSYVQLDSAGYDPNDPVATSHPDDYTPRDRMGHGTAIAMIAAGVQNTGPAATIEGVAPKAFLGNYKVFGSPGINDTARFAAIIQALQDAVADGMEIVTLSLSEGDPAFYAPLDVDPACGGDGTCDIISQAVENAVKQGVVVVASAGNDGNIGQRTPTLDTIHYPGTAPSAITVGAVMNAHTFYQSVVVNGSGSPGTLRAVFGDGPHIAAKLTAPVRDVTQTGNDGLACASMPGGSLTGTIALIQRGTCAFSDKINNAQNAGAIGVIIYQLAGQDTIFGNWNAQNTGIPAVMIGNTDGLALKSYLASNSSATATLDPSLTEAPATASVMWPASSRGPSPGTFGSTPTNVIKPELVAVGVGVYTATGPERRH
jgi:minor extracellular serine protease Vpr